VRSVRQITQEAQTPIMMHNAIDDNAGIVVRE